MRCLLQDPILHSKLQHKGKELRQNCLQSRSTIRDREELQVKSELKITYWLVLDLWVKTTLMKLREVVGYIQGIKVVFCHRPKTLKGYT